MRSVRGCLQTTGLARRVHLLKRQEEMRNTLSGHCRDPRQNPRALPSSQTGLQIRYGQQGAQLGLSDTNPVAHRTVARMSPRTENYEEMWMEQEPTPDQTQMG